MRTEENRSRSRQGSGFLPITALLLLAAPILLGACKPTERNYQAAYELALEKRDTKDPDADLIYGGHELQSPLGAVRERVGDIELKSLRVPLTRVDGDSLATAGRYRVAVALYSMKENARAHAADLREALSVPPRSRAEGLPASPVPPRPRAEGPRDPGIGVFRQGDEKYFVTVASLPTLQDAARHLDSIRSAAPDAHYIGLHQSEPLLLISPR